MSFPKWEQMFPGLMQEELKALERLGVNPVIDEVKLKSGTLVLDIEWPVREFKLHLRVTYPDFYPYFRPDVKLLSGLDSFPDRHCSPVDGTLCLLGRDSRMWTMSWTLATLLTNQLENAIFGLGPEDPQGEPAEFWWNSLAGDGNYCLIDSAWNSLSGNEGYLTVVCDSQHQADESGNPSFKGYVKEVKDINRKVLFKWNSVVPLEIKDNSFEFEVPWIQLEKTLNPTKGSPISPVLSFLKSNDHLKRAGKVKFSRKNKGSVFCVVHPVELEFKKMSLSFLFIVNFKGSRDTNFVSIIKTLRAGRTDLNVRVPSVKTLNQAEIVVCGAGSIGAPLILDLARNGCKKIIVFEYDILEPGNSIRWPLGAAYWGSLKGEAVKDFLSKNYPDTEIVFENLFLGAPHVNDKEYEKFLLMISKSNLVIDATTSYGVVTMLYGFTSHYGIPLISLFASPDLQGGCVSRFTKSGGCPVCQQFHWDLGSVTPPEGLVNQTDELIQAPGCSERTFAGAGFDLKELSLQCIRLVTQTIDRGGESSIVQTLKFVNKGNYRIPQWDVDELIKHEKCDCT